MQESAEIAAHFLRHDVQTIVFGRARLATELMLTHLRDELPRGAAQAVRGYRGGYLPSDRREIERGLREAAVRGVVATNALELGIDIGRPRCGDPGRPSGNDRQRPAADGPGGPAAGRLRRSAGRGRADRSTSTSSRTRAGCCSSRPSTRASTRTTRSSSPATWPAPRPSCRCGRGRRSACSRGHGAAWQTWSRPASSTLSGGRYFWAGEGSPTQALSLRSAGSDRVVIQARGEDGKPVVIGELDREGVPLLLYEGAIYLHEGASYVVERLDWDAGVAAVRGHRRRLLHAPGHRREDRRARRRAGRSSGEAAPYHLGWGDVRVTSQATSYKILRRGSNEVLGYGQIDLPEQTLDTQAAWLAFPEHTVEALKAAGAWLSDPNDYGPEWGATRDAVRQRDGYRCQGCGTVEMAGRQHDVHHKIPFRAFVADEARREGLPATLGLEGGEPPRQPGDPVPVVPSPGRGRHPHAVGPGRRGRADRRRRAALPHV